MFYEVKIFGEESVTGPAENKTNKSANSIQIAVSDNLPIGTFMSFKLLSKFSKRHDRPP